MSAAGRAGDGSPDVALHADVQTAAARGLKIVLDVQLCQHVLCLAKVFEARGLHRAVDRLAEGHPHRGAGDHAALGQIRRAFPQRFKRLEADDEVAEGLARAVLVGDVGQRVQVPLLRGEAALARRDALTEPVVPDLERAGDAARAQVEIAVDHVVPLGRRDVEQQLAL